MTPSDAAGDDAVAPGEVLGPWLEGWWLLADDQALFADLALEVFIFWWIEMPNTAGDNRNRSGF